MPKFAANLSTMFNDLPFIERFGAARAAGFDAVEFLFPYAFDPDEIVAKSFDMDSALKRLASALEMPADHH